MPVPGIMGYDAEPLAPMVSKRVLFARAMQEDWLLIFQHDVSVPWGQLARGGKGYSLAQE